jgi:hypothetical protein
VEVGGQDVEGIELYPQPGIELKGRITIEGATVDFEDVDVFLVAPEGPRRGNISAEIDEEGNLTFDDLITGKYEIHFRGSGGQQYLKSARWGGVDVLESGLTLGPGSQPRLELVVAESDSSVTGVVRSEGGAAEASAFVVLVDAKLGRVYRSVHTMFSGSDGGFSFGPIAPAEYRVFAFDQEVDVWRELELFEEFEKKSKVVRIGPNEKVTIELTLIKLPQE